MLTECKISHAAGLYDEMTIKGVVMMKDEPRWTL